MGLTVEEKSKESGKAIPLDMVEDSSNPGCLIGVDALRNLSGVGSRKPIQEENPWIEDEDEDDLYDE